MLDEHNIPKLISLIRNSKTIDPETLGICLEQMAAGIYTLKAQVATLDDLVGSLASTIKVLYDKTRFS